MPKFSYVISCLTALLTILKIVKLIFCSPLQCFDSLLFMSSEVHEKQNTVSDIQLSNTQHLVTLTIRIEFKKTDLKNEKFCVMSLSNMESS